MAITVNYANQHISVDSEGNTIQTLTYVSEPLGNPPEHGYGWPRLDFEQAIGGDEWIIKRKLGWGVSSSIWLAFDQKQSRYVAIKALKSSENIRACKGDSFEFEALQAVTVTKTPSPHCLKLFAACNVPGKGRDGIHLCYVTQLQGGNVASLMGNDTFPFPLAKRIILHTLRGIAHTHKHGFIHTDLKLDNILFSCNMSTEDITSLLISDPSRRHDPEYSGDGIVQAAVSQPLPVPSFDDAMKRTFLLGDYSHAQPLSDRPPRSIAIAPHRPPENIILGPWNEKADIWEFGCVAFELITARLPFDWESRPEYQLNEEANLLYQMMNITQEAFSLDQLAKSDKRNDFFDKDGNLLSKPPAANVNDGLVSKIRKLTNLEEAEVTLTAQFISRCFHLNPEDRPNALDLLSDPFLNGVD
ncbi:Dual specificity protein kinase lkh1 [Termitomyces sp. J132]|nr:hypothetical protein H2248_011267 [Termitomyces sp. 'cryptogamus']KNZ77012.1 Dual specificity protein kinase lkh1 [Termitomyces sp. J132]